MNKIISCYLALSVAIFSASFCFASEVEYYQMSEGNPILDLAEGEVAEAIGVSYIDNSMSSEAGLDVDIQIGNSQYTFRFNSQEKNPALVGPCKVKLPDLDELPGTWPGTPPRLINFKITKAPSSDAEIEYFQMTNDNVTLDLAVGEVAEMIGMSYVGGTPSSNDRFIDVKMGAYNYTFRYSLGKGFFSTSKASAPSLVGP